MRAIIAALAVQASVRTIPAPILASAARFLADRGTPISPYRYCADGWPNTAEGWHASGVLASFTEQRRALHARLAHGIVTDTLDEQGRIMTFLAMLARAARSNTQVSVLDWGGGYGQYYLVARAFLPDLILDYHVKELPAIAHEGRHALPAITWHDTDACLERRYDLVFASGALHYQQDWHNALARMAGAVGRYLFLTRTPIVSRHPSFVVAQTAYDTTYPGWFLHRDALLAAFHAQGLTCVQEVLAEHAPVVPGAPDQCRMHGFLCQPAHRTADTQ